MNNLNEQDLSLKQEVEELKDLIEMNHIFYKKLFKAKGMSEEMFVQAYEQHKSQWKKLSDLPTPSPVSKNEEGEK